ncbi:hypothetical protein FQR65_LT01846 [Abscondita terminalis]|nr:hypothetical protein FQR65_LT01846 [Abscondita terminalis]
MMWLILIAVICIVIYYKISKTIPYWEDRGVPHQKPFSLIGTIGVLFSKHKSFFDYVCDVYNEFPKERYFGIYQSNKPALYIKDLDLIKRIAVKDFDQFTDHNNFAPLEIDPDVTRNLFNLKGQRWRDMRSTLSPSFTSSKMKVMFTLVSECAEAVTTYFLKLPDAVHEVEMKDVCTRFTNDAIASIGFGFKCNSLENKENDFYVNAKKVTELKGWSFVLLIIQMMIPKIFRLFKLRVTPVESSNFFRRIIQDTINKREKEGLVRHDMIHLLLEARKGKEIVDDHHLPDAGFATIDESKLVHSNKKPKLDISDDDIAAQAFIFIFGGFDTSASLASFVTYELAVNPEVQEKLQNEIDDTLNSCDGKVTYEALHHMKYLDMVVCETLRKWPSAFQNDRICGKNYVIEPVHPWEKTIVIEKGTTVLFPIVGIHRDPKYFPNPDVFDPERFSNENKHNIIPNSYLPFGIGPRSCIASRFGLMENKILIFHLLSKFDIVRTEKTPFPLRIATGTVNFTAEGGFWMGLKKRTN